MVRCKPLLPSKLRRVEASTPLKVAGYFVASNNTTHIHMKLQLHLSHHNKVVCCNLPNQLAAAQQSTNPAPIKTDESGVYGCLDAW